MYKHKDLTWRTGSIVSRDIQLVFEVFIGDTEVRVVCILDFSVVPQLNLEFLVLLFGQEVNVVIP